MKVVLLSTFDKLGGAAIGSLRLHKALLNIGVDSKMLVQWKDNSEPTIIGPETIREKILAKIKPYADSFITKFYKQRPVNKFSTSILPDRLPEKVAALTPDVIYLHWVARGFLQIETLKHFDKPLVWKLADSWAFTGGCHLPFDCTRYRESCGACPVLGSTKEYDLSRWIWHRKRKSWKDLDLTIVTPSHWLAECARSSSLFRNLRIEVIPNGLDVTRFKPMDKLAAREFLSLPPDKKLILFGALSNSTGDRNKGFHLLLPALQKLAANGWSDRAEVTLLGASEPVNPPEWGMKASYSGRLHDEISMAVLYSAADVLVAPSMQENLSNMVMEGLACGTPCVAFDIGGMPDMIEHQCNGYLARPFEIDDLAQGIAWVLEDEKRHRQLCDRARKKVEEEFTQELQAHRYVSLFQEVCERSRSRK